MESFKELIAKGHEGCFVYEPNKLVEINVDYGKGEIKVEYFRTENHLQQPIKKEFFHSLFGIFGTKTVEEQFNEILKNHQ